MRSIAPSGGGGNAVPSIALDSGDDPRLEAFAEFVSSLDSRDWKAGQLATRRLRALGISVCLLPPPGDRRGA